jgi:hypothetical protein
MVKNKKAVIGFIFLTVILLPLISSSGVATPYWDENPLKMSPGESVTVTLSLQNMVGEEDIKVKAELSSEGNIAALVDPNPEYSVPFGRDNVPVSIKITIPSDAQVGTKYDISASFRQVSDETGQMLHVASAFTSELPVEVVGVGESPVKEEPKAPEKTNNMFTYVLLLLGIVLVVIVIVAVRKNMAPDKK